MNSIESAVNKNLVRSPHANRRSVQFRGMRIVEQVVVIGVCKCHCMPYPLEYSSADKLVIHIQQSCSVNIRSASEQ